MSAYATLEKRFKRLSDLDDAAAILQWDQSVMMPDGASSGRGEQLATLAGLSHELLVEPEIGNLLGEAEGVTLDGWQAANLGLMRRRYMLATAVDSSLVEALARATTTCEMLWRTARAASDFAALRPSLEEVLKLTREDAKARAGKLGVTPYEALLDAYEPGLRESEVERLFQPLARDLPAIIDRVIARQTEPVALEGTFATAEQEALARRLMTSAGFDFTRGRLDRSMHPFCGGAKGDIRITTRYDESDPLSALMGVMHETGHALYEAGLPDEWRAQPVGRARGIAVHESQSLLVEMQICRSDAFLGFLAGELHARFGVAGPALEPENLRRLARHVRRSFIRVEADEVTYPLHVILRYRLESAMIAGDLAVADLPGAWNDGFSELLGVVPPDDRRGCLQDIHWPIGGFGYFPCYTLGALMAAQLREAAAVALPDLDGDVAQGRLAPLVGWLKEHVHGEGSRLSFPEIVQSATGRPLDTGAFMRHVDRRYLA